ncbi:site-specific integrase [Burkholderia ubonensis]|uniref:site-specific integrase n=1 Tax=Burkholderia ubonensis TaxID=101571 RepID=UPI000A65ACC8|nr:site-specific integrase [Burkholderia ubonensis]
MKTNRARYQSRTDDTVARYLKRADSLLSRIADEMQLPEDAYPAPSDVVAYMKRHAQEWKWSTFRQYQASLVCRYQIEFERSGDQIFETTANEIRSLPYSDCKPEREPGQTSSRKRKGIPKRDYDVLVANLANPKQGGDYAKRTALWLIAALATGLRPCEWQKAQLSEDETALVVQNAKATNGRATGVSRSVPVRADDLPVIRAHLDALRELRGKGLTFNQIHNRCGEALNRACKAIWGKDSSKRYALYSARHQFAANTKAVASPEEVAALLGHRSTRTARRHYAPRRSAWLQFKQSAKPVVSNDPTPKPN